MQQIHSHICHLLRYLLVVLALESVAFGQITNVTNDQATPTPGVGHDYIQMLDETVNPANGSVSLRIQVPVPPGRKVTLPFAFTYDSSGVHHLESEAPGQIVWIPGASYLLQGGWGYSVPLVSEGLFSPTWTDPGNNLYTCNYYDDYVFVDPSGGRHALGLAVVEDPLNPACVNAPPFPRSVLQGGDDLFAATASATAPYYPVTVADADGTVYHFPNPRQDFWPSGEGFASALPDYIEDRNGNRVSITDSGNGAFTISDTLGRTAFSSSGFGANVNTVSVSGLSNSYYVSWGIGTIYSSFSVGSTTSNNQNCPQNLPNERDNQAVVRSITLPSGQIYTFEYDSDNPSVYDVNPYGSYGLLSKIHYPSGGYVKYIWGQNSQSEFGVFPSWNAESCTYTYGIPAVSSRIVSFDGQTEALEQDFSYSTTWGSYAWTSKQTTVTTHDLLRGTSFTTTYTYGPVSVALPPNEYSLFASQVPVEQSVVYNDIGGGTIRTVMKNWVDQYEMQGQQISANGTVTSDQFFVYDPGNHQITDKYECGSAQTCYNATQASPPSAYARHTKNSYHGFGTTPIYTAGPSIFDRPDSVIVYDGSGSRVAETDYLYDGSSLAETTGLLGHDYTNYSSSYENRGNATSKTAWLNAGGTSPLTTYTYDDTGQVQSMIDPCGNNGCSDMVDTNHTTSYNYSNENAYLSQINYPTTGNGAAHSVSFTYNFADGQLASATDQNGKPTYYLYGQNGDLLNRLAEVDYPDGGKTTYGYGNVCGHPSTTTMWLNGSSTYNAAAIMDGMCQVTETAITDPEGAALKTDTTYDGMARAWTVSNPYRSTSDPTYGLTTYVYDALGRTTSVTYPDTTAATTSYSTNCSASPGDCTTVTDAAGRTRRLWTDALGRLTSVTEDPGTGHLNYPTAYTYDALDNLQTVSQSGQSRDFIYDSLSLLSTATNPESGQVQYTYDANGNVISKVAPAENQPAGSLNTVATTYTYDALNRLLTKNYNDTNYSDPPTVRACYAYDGAYGWGDTMTNAIGHLTSSWSVQHDGTVVAADESYQFDPMGRLQAGRQCTPATCGTSTYPVSMGYDLAGNQLNFWDSSVLRYSSYDSANRLSNFSATFNAAEPSEEPPPTGPGTQALLNITAHSPFGGLTNASLGNGLAESRSYNIRGWLGSIEVGSVYSLNIPAPPVGYAGNGNVLIANDSENGNWSYGYDNVNRLQTAAGNGQSFSYNVNPNPWGNMTCSNTGNLACTPLGLAFNSANNQITTSGYNYDAAGNLLTDNTHGYVYDAENRIACVGVDINGNCTTSSTYYFYDPQGQRVGKQRYDILEDYVYDTEGHISSVHDGSANLLRTELYSPDGRHVATINPSANYGPLFWNHADWLGTERMRTDSGGTPREWCTDTPYGMNLACTDSSQTDVSPMHFTGKQRDYESNLDYFGARYLGGGNNLGRFMSPDEPLEDQYASDPQSWNLYSYARNNPTTDFDLDGRACVQGIDGSYSDDRSGGQSCAQVAADNAQQQPSVTVTGSAPTIGTEASMAGAALLAGAETGPADPLIVAGAIFTVAVYACYQTSCLNVFSKSKNPPDPTPATPSVSNTASPNPPGGPGKKVETPKSNPEKFRPIRGTSAKLNTETGEVFQRDLSQHGGDHYEVYKNLRDFQNGIRDHQVWADGTVGKSY